MIMKFEDVMTIFLIVILTVLYYLKPDVHTEKRGCEYVEKAECKQVWVKK